MKKILFTAMLAMVLVSTVALTGCEDEGIEETVGDKGISVTLEDACFAEPSSSPEGLDTLVVWLTFENTGTSALYFDCAGYVYLVADDEDIELPEAVELDGANPQASIMAPTETCFRALKPKQIYDSKFKFAMEGLFSVLEDEDIKLVVYAEDSKSTGVTVEFGLPDLEELWECTADDLK